MNEIQHYRQIDIIRLIEKEIESTGKKLFNISHWNSGEDYKSGLLKILNLGSLSNYFDYSYSYSIDPEIIKAITKMHRDAQQCALFYSATSAINAIGAMLKQLSMHKVCILTPSYFSVYESLHAHGFEIVNCFYSYDGCYHIPVEELRKINADVIWITQPVFSTGIYLLNDEICGLSNECKILVCDASMCQHENIAEIDFDYNKSLVILSPHKTIAINGIKFSYVLCNSMHRHMLEDWGDVVTGGLPASSLLAISHYLSNNFSECVEYHNQYTTKSRKIIDSVLAQHNSIVHIGKSLGTYESYSFKGSNYSADINSIPLKQIFADSQASFVPGCVNEFPPENNLCFRLNHTLDIRKTESAMLRLVSISI